jgi:acetyl esterase/lipase
MKLAKPILGSLDYATLRTAQDRLGLLIHPVKNTCFERVCIGDIPAAWVRPDVSASGNGVILYCHGGSYVAGSLSYARILSSRLASHTGLDTLALDYRLAPEYPFPAALDDLSAAYAFLLNQGFRPESIALAGESAGGGLILAFPQLLREQKLPMPGALVCMSAWTNLACDFESSTYNLTHDPVLIPESLIMAGLLYAGCHSVINPLISPAFADFSGYPPALFQAGSLEVLLDDSRVCCEKMKAAGADARIEVFDGMWHAFQVQNVPETREALASIGSFLQEKLRY